MADPATCQGCHADIAESYRSVAMARSFRRPADADAIDEKGMTFREEN